MNCELDPILIPYKEDAQVDVKDRIGKASVVFNLRSLGNLINVNSLKNKIRILSTNVNAVLVTEQIHRRP